MLLYLCYQFNANLLLNMPVEEFTKQSIFGATIQRIGGLLFEPLYIIISRTMLLSPVRTAGR